MVSSSARPTHWQTLLALPSKYIGTLTTSQYLHCSLTGSLQEPSCYFPCFRPGTLSPQGHVTSTSAISIRTPTASSYPPPAHSPRGVRYRASPSTSPRTPAHCCPSNTLHLPSSCLEGQPADTCMPTPFPAPSGASDPLALFSNPLASLFPGHSLFFLASFVP